MVGIPVLIMRITRGNPMTVSTGRISVVASDPDVAPVSPFIMPRNPDSGAVGTLPSTIFAIPRRSLIPYVDGE